MLENFRRRKGLEMRSEGREKRRKSRLCAQQRGTDEGRCPRGFEGKPEETGELWEFANHVWVTKAVAGRAVAVSGRKSMDGKDKGRGR